MKPKRWKMRRIDSLGRIVTGKTPSTKKNEYFDGQFSPRLAAIYTVGDRHNFRVSYQNGFRMPTTQDQFIQLDVVTRLLIGSNQDLVDRYRFETNTVYQAQSVAAARQIANNGGTDAEARAVLVPIEFDDFKTEDIADALF